MDGQATRRRAASVLMVAAICALAASFWQWRIIAPVQLPQKVSGDRHADLYSIYYPVHTFAYRGEKFLPAWNPYQLAGTPFVASYNGGFLYPVNFLSAVLPVHRAIGYGCAIHIALAGLFVFACARSLSLSSPAASLGAVGFMFNDYFLVERFHPSYLAGFAWIPFVFLCAGWLVHRPGWWTGVWLGIGVTVQFLTGHAQIVCYTVYCLLVVAPVYLLCRGEWRGRYLGRLTAAVAVAVATALLLSAVQLLPTLELVGQAARGFQGLTYEQTQPWVVDWQRLRRVGFSAGPVVMLAVLGLMDRRRPHLLLAATVLVAFTALVALWAPFYRDFFYLFPGVKLFRLRQAILAIGAFGLAILAGIGVDRTVSARPGWQRRLIAGTVLGLWGLLLSARPNPAIPVYYTSAVLGVILLALLLNHQGARRLLAWLVVALVVAQRFSGPEFNHVMLPQHNPEAFFAAPPSVEFLRHRVGADRVLVMKNWHDRFPIMEKMGMLYGINVVQDYEPLAPRAYHDFLLPMERWNVDAPLFWGRFFPHPQSPSWQLLDLMATRYVLVASGARFPTVLPSRFRIIYAGPDAQVYENTAAMPRAYLVGPQQVRVVSDSDESLAAVQAESFDPRATVVVEREVGWTLPAGKVPMEESVRFVRIAAEEIVLAVSTPRQALLVVADLYWPGWKVSVDGVPGDVYRTNHLFRGVPVEPGAHTVRFWYDPLGLKVGGGVTVATMAVLTILAVVRRWGYRHRASATDRISPEKPQRF